jgi:hypothetical protein
MPWRRRLLAGLFAGATAIVIATLHGADRRFGLGVECLVAAMIWTLGVSAALSPRPSRRPRQAQRLQPAKPDELARVERSVDLARSQASALHMRLRPLLREAAAERLSRRGLDLDSGDARVRSALGEDGWELLRPDREPPRNPLAAGLPLDRLDHVIERLEAL